MALPILNAAQAIHGANMERSIAFKSSNRPRMESG
jgi:hypothetical protein